ncbi:glycosyltransferase [Leptolyngbya sp. FACHB-17]|uniref:glycosyltransferase n=1 Tax=unclassified Leptolyngbya TaxID=2650499 RepID=UPI0032200471
MNRSSNLSQDRPKVIGKFIFINGEKFYIKGTTYGTFCPNSEGEPFPEPEIVAKDFAQMAANHINAVRVYTVPPLWLLDIAYENHLRVMVGLPWEQHIAFLDETNRIKNIKYRVRIAVRSCATHPALLCFVIGNEIPASIVRWYGPARVVRFLEDLYWIVKSEDLDSLVTYVNYPSTEYLQVPFVNFYCFNVYLESEDCFESYLARLQNLAEDKPLVMAEIGLDSQRNGEKTQAKILEWQTHSIFEAGCAGCFIFAWTDEWYRGGFEIEDWDFGLTTRSRQPKPALEQVHQSFAEMPFSPQVQWPQISVAVCSYNGSSTIRNTLEALQQLEYPNFEVIVVDDGSTDNAAQIAREYANVRVIVHEYNQGLSCARNTALEAATGEVIAYIDDDAYPDPHWLTYLALTLLKGDWAGVGGPNLPPPGDGLIADCVANAPGGPIHVLVSDREAEHIPGCNMAYWVAKLKTIGGFDGQFRTAGDDVDICWRLQDQGWKIGFSPAAVVWHHRRNCVKTYWKQQKGYGKAEALLEAKWPEKYNAAGHLSWAGRLYGKGLVQMLPLQKQRIYHGIWGSAPFQSIYQTAPTLLAAILSMPEWYLVAVLLAGLSSLSWFWHPALFAVPLFVAVIITPLIQAGWSASHAKFTTPNLSLVDRGKLYGLTTILYCLQPIARLWGRIDNGLTPWRRRGNSLPKWSSRRQDQIWSEVWCSSTDWLSKIKQHLSQQGAVALHGGDFDPWDLEIRGGLTGSARLLIAIEEHGGGKQLIQLRCWSRITPAAIVILVLLASLTVFAAIDRAVVASLILGSLTIGFAVASSWDCASAMASYLTALQQVQTEEQVEK